MRTRLRRLALVAALVPATLVLAAPAAHAAADWSTSTISSPGPFTSGELIAVTLDIVNTGDAGPVADSIAIRDGEYTSLTIEGTPTVTDGPGAGADMSAQVTPAPNSASVSIGAGFTTGDARVTFQVRLPKYYDEDFLLSAAGLSGTFKVREASRHIVSKGGPSQLVIDRVGQPYPFVVTKDSTPTATFRVTNFGTGTAENVKLSKSSYGSVDAYLPQPPSPFSPTATYTSGCAAIVDSGDGCELAPLAPGASTDVVLALGGLTHYGTADTYLNLRTASEDGDETSQSSAYVRIGDGTAADTDISLHGPSTAAGNADITYTGTVQVQGNRPVGQSIVVVWATGFDTAGRRTSEEDLQVASIKSITLSNGATCAKYVDTTVTPNVTYPNEWRCPVAGLAAGSRLTATVVANFPTARRNANVEVSIALRSLTYLRNDDTSWDTALNVDRTATAELTGSAPEIVGAGRVVPVTVSVKNTGNTVLRGAGAGLSVPVTAGELLTDLLQTGCTNGGIPTRVYCGSDEGLAPGATRSWVVKVRMTTTLGPTGVMVTPNEWGSESANAYYGEWWNLDRVVTLRVVAPSQVPFDGVKAAKVPSRNVTQLAAAGLPSTFTCPVRCRATVKLRVTRSVAMRLRLIGKSKNTAGYVVIGTSSKGRASGGRLVVTTKVAKKYQAAVKRLGVPLPLQRVSSVVSTAVDNKDATWTATTAITIKPKPRKRGR